MTALPLLVWYCTLSALAFIVYAHDKSAARQLHRRISEQTLHLIGLAGGWPGALLAQHIFRHKTKKQRFQLVFWGTVILNCSVALLYLSPAAQALFIRA